MFPGCRLHLHDARSGRALDVRVQDGTVRTGALASRSADAAGRAAAGRSQAVESDAGEARMAGGFSADGKTALVANHGDGSVLAIDIATATVTKNFKAGTGIETLTYY